MPGHHPRVPAGSGRGNAPRSTAGQSLVELAIVLPVLLILVLFAVDLGRVFLGFVTINNASRIAANFAAQHPAADYTDPTDPDTQAYRDILSKDTSVANCTVLSAPAPVFTDGPDVGTAPNDVSDTVRVDIRCAFRLITPIIGDIIGQNVTMNASSVFEVRAGLMTGLPDPVFVPLPSLAPPASPSPSPSPGPSPSPSATCTPGPLAIPDLVNPNPETVSQARTEWTSAGFTGAFNPSSGSTNKSVLSQSLPPGLMCAANTSITVTHS